MRWSRHEAINHATPLAAPYPLFRLLAINLAIGACAASLLVAGLLWLNPGHLRELIFADSSPGIALLSLLAAFLTPRTRTH
ncbi:hypothetical protein [Bradyrhizobium liaoningense]|uniref:hypothetical protein n=1 Tax=Bradyrhizobium liaoningense TaxID=43992 RepID=UPI003908B833